MAYKVGDTIIAKKNHACGGKEWLVTRTGADIKLKCKKCGRIIFLSVDETSKMAKTHLPGETVDG
jgi:hypothetical protein